MSISVRPMLSSDLHAALALDQQTNPHPWTPTQWQAALQEHECLALDTNGGLAGLAVTHTVLDEAELLLIAISPTQQRRGLGKQLLTAVINNLRTCDVARLFLEVRASNAPAQALYAQAGGVQVGVRKRYYPTATGGREDAINVAFQLAHTTHGAQS